MNCQTYSVSQILRHRLMTVSYSRPFIPERLVTYVTSVHSWLISAIATAFATFLFENPVLKPLDPS